MVGVESSSRSSGEVWRRSVRTASKAVRWRCASRRPLALGDRSLRELADDRQRVSFAAAGLDDHEDRHSDQHSLDDAVEVRARDNRNHGLEDPIVNQVRDEQVKALKSMEAHYGVGAKAFGGQDDDGTNPADSGNVAEHRGGARRNGSERIGETRRCVRLARTALGAEDIRRVYLISALAAKRHP